MAINENENWFWKYELNFRKRKRPLKNMMISVFISYKVIHSSSFFITFLKNIRILFSSYSEVWRSKGGFDRKICWKNSFKPIFRGFFYKIRSLFISDGIWKYACLMHCLHRNKLKLSTCGGNIEEQKWWQRQNTHTKRATRLKMK